MYGTVFVISGPSGSGKGTLIKRLLVHFFPRLFWSVSVTTREIGPNEEHGREYCFISQGKFDVMVRMDELLECAGVYNKSYGTPRDPIVRALERGTSPVLEVNLAGMRQVRLSYPDAVTIFIQAPSKEEAKRRMRARGRDSEEVIVKRLRDYETECARSDLCRYHVTNDDLEATFAYLVEVFEQHLAA